MKITLRALFVLTLIFAILSFWLASRRTNLYPATLVQFVAPVAQKGAQQIDAEQIEADFYAALESALQQSKSTGWSANDFRKKIEFTVIDKDGNTALANLSAVGNPLTTNREDLKDLYGTAIETLSNSVGGTLKVKMLSVPKL